MEYFIVVLSLILLMLVYFKVADKYNIIDRPNHRSAHTEVTLRGGGIIFPIAFIFLLGFQVFFKKYSFSFDNSIYANLWIFGAGLFTISIISFLDDMVAISTRNRLIFHFIAVTLLLYFLNCFHVLPLWAIPICYIMIIGTLNAYNFMDGINGISAVYTIVALGSLLYVNHYIISFVDADFIIYPIIASIVFLYFNFRKKAKCFLGDIGSMGIGFWIISLLALLMLKTGEIKWILFLTVYGVDVIFTILERLKLKENIFEAHRRHLYQLFANSLKVDHRIVSIAYAFFQLIINSIIITVNLNDLWTIVILVIPTSIFYLFLKYKIKKQIVSS